MTQRATGFRYTIAHARVPVILGTLTLGACGSQVGGGPLAPGDSPSQPRIPADGGVADNGDKGNNDGGLTPVGPGGNPLTPCGQSAAKAKTAVETYCASCHGAPSTAKGGFASILDVPALLQNGKVIANKASDSPLYKRMKGGTMPPADVQKRPGDADIKAVEDWIGCGAPDWNAEPGSGNGGTLKFVSIDSRLRTILDDLRAMPNPIDRTRARYIDLSNLANAGFSDDQIQTYRETVSFLMNSLSRGRSVVAPRAVDEQKLIYRIDLRDYLWDAASWRLLEAEYPYAVVYDQDSRLFPFDEVTSEQIRRETGTQIPVIQGDWLITHASRPPLYHDLLKLPDTLQGLEAQLGVNIEENIRNEEVIRSGFKNAGPSQNHRILERHELGGSRGAFWVSYDFADNVGQRNIFANPLDFEEDGGEMIFNLDNGLQAYFISQADGTRLDKAPNNVVQDPLSRDGTVENGLSCMTCHQEDGQLPKFDEIRDFILTSGASARETEAVLALYADRETLSEVFTADQNRYRTARAALGIKKLDATTMHSLDDTHQSTLDINMVAAVIGIPVKDLERALSSTPQLFPAEVVALRAAGGGIQRDAFEAVIDDIVEALGLGTPLRVSRNGTVRR